MTRPAESEDAEVKLPRRLLEAVDARLRYRPSPSVRRLLLAVAALVFLGGGLLALRAIDLDPGQLRWLPLIASAVVGVPLTAVAGAMEYQVMARVTGQDVDMRNALRVSVLASAANILPVPGSVLVRIKALTGRGTSLLHSTTVTGVLGFTWVAVALAVAGGFLLGTARPLVGLAFMAGALIPGSTLFLLRYAIGREDWAVHVLEMVAVEGFTVCIAALRIWLVLLGLGVTASWSAAFVFPLAGSLTAAIGFFPAGIGIREVFTAALAPLVGLPSSLGFVVSALNRVLAALGFAPMAVLLLSFEQDPPDREDVERDDRVRPGNQSRSGVPE